MLKSEDLFHSLIESAMINLQWILKNEIFNLTRLKPIKTALSLKHLLHIMRLYFLINPYLAMQILQQREPFPFLYFSLCLRYNLFGI